MDGPLGFFLTWSTYGTWLSEKARSELKAWATRCLKEQFDSTRRNGWAKRGGIRHLYGDEAVETTSLEAQHRKSESARLTSSARNLPTMESPY